MHTRTFRPLVFAALFVLVVGMACNFGAADPTPTPTNPPPPTPTTAPSPTPQPSPTSEPASAPTRAPQIEVEPSAPFDISSSLYVHPQGHFELYPPAGWTAEEDSGSVSFADPTGVGFIYLQLTNVGYEFDADAFEQFILARELNFFGTYDAYSEIDRSVDRDNRTATVYKSLNFDGIPQTVVTYYDQKGAAVYALDFWADRDVFDAYNAQYDVIFDTITVDSSLVFNELLYNWVYTFYGPGDLFSIEVPTSFLYEYSEDSTSIVETFYSPDNHAIIQNITYDDGSVISKSVAGAFALELLRSYYAQDIRITDDQVQPDGSERLTWYSQGGAYSGISFLETRGTTFLMFTVLWDDAYEDIYFDDVLDYTIGTYTIP